MGAQAALASVHVPLSTHLINDPLPTVLTQEQGDVWNNLNIQNISKVFYKRVSHASVQPTADGKR